MIDDIAKALGQYFLDQDKRIVFWSDEAAEFTDELGALDTLLPDVTVLVVANNEFGIKYRVLRQQPADKFLIYRSGAAPAHQDNWLLDVELAAVTFVANRAQMVMNELGLPSQLASVVQDHAVFFESKERTAKLSVRLGDQAAQLKRTELLNHMLASCVGGKTGGGGGAGGGGSFSLDTVVEGLLADLATGRFEETWRLVVRCGLDGHLFDRLAQNYAYLPPTDVTPSVEGFAISLFEDALCEVTADSRTLNNDASHFFQRWKSDRRSEDHFRTLSARFAGVVGLQSKLAQPVDGGKAAGNKHGSDSLAANMGTLDAFVECDQAVLEWLIDGVVRQTLAFATVDHAVRARRQSIWFDQFADVYGAIRAAAEFQHLMASAKLDVYTAAEGWRSYTGQWFKIDQLYRQFLWYYQQAGKPDALAQLYDWVENYYSNKFVLLLNDRWHDQVARMERWAVEGVARQQDFYAKRVVPIREKKAKVAVLISDALRYEVAEEFTRAINGREGQVATLDAMLGALPSYTQLGMAALLPNQDLSLVANAKGDLAVEAFGKSTASGNREKILSMGRPDDQVRTLRADDFMALSGSEGKDLHRANDVVYVYHNRIDALGDKTETEADLAIAVKGTIDELTVLVRKLLSANFTRVLVTADHGFLYQHRALDDTDFAASEPVGQSFAKKSRRFAVGTGLDDGPGCRHWSAEQLGLGGDMEVITPNSINRWRVQSAGSRFVHGGSSLQEIVLPVVEIRHSRKDEVVPVQVQILKPERSKITTGLFTVRMYQVQPMDQKTPSRRLFAGVYAQDGALLSNLETLDFDFESENPRDREMTVQFALSKAADNYNRQTVFVKLRSQFKGTEKFEEYDTIPMEISRGMTTDF